MQREDNKKVQDFVALCSCAVPVKLVVRVLAGFSSWLFVGLLPLEREKPQDWSQFRTGHTQIFNVKAWFFIVSVHNIGFPSLT